MEVTNVAEVASNESWDFIKWLLSGAVMLLGFALLYLFNQIQALKEGIQTVRDEVKENKQAIALNDQHDNVTDGVLGELKDMIKALGEKIDTLISKK